MVCHIIQGMSKSRGFTLVELMVVVAIAAVLASLAVPSFKHLIQSSSISTSVNTFLGDLRFARSEALRRGGAVIMCRSDSPEATSPVCGSGSGTGGIGWATGWIVFYDQDGNGDRSASSTDPVLRRQAALTSLDYVLQTTGGSSTRFEFTATGRIRNLSSGVVTMQFGGGKFKADVQRTVCVSIGGRGRVAGDGNASCT